MRQLFSFITHYHLTTIFILSRGIEKLSAANQMQDIRRVKRSRGSARAKSH